MNHSFSGPEVVPDEPGWPAGPAWLAGLAWPAGWLPGWRPAWPAATEPPPPLLLPQVDYFVFVYIHIYTRDNISPIEKYKLKVKSKK